MIIHMLEQVINIFDILVDSITTSHFYWPIVCHCKDCATVTFLMRLSDHQLYSAWILQSISRSELNL